MNAKVETTTSLILAVRHAVMESLFLLVLSVMMAMS
jgi:hypothetical protein